MNHIHFILSLDFTHPSGLKVYSTACGEAVQGKNLTLPTGVFAGQGETECPKCKEAMATMPPEPPAVESIDVGDGGGTSAEEWEAKTNTPAKTNKIKEAVEKLRARINSGNAEGVVAGRNGLRLTEVRSYQECAAALDVEHENMPGAVDEATRRRIEQHDPAISKDYETKKAERLGRRPRP